MKWTSSLSREGDLSRALDETASAALAELGAAPDLAFVFASAHYSKDFEHLPAQARARLGARHLLGCSGSGVIGGGHEIEQDAALAVTAARLEGVEVECWHAEGPDLRPGSAHSERCSNLAAAASGPPQFIVLADPFSFPIEQLLRGFDGAFPHSVIAGGLASGGQAAGDIVLFVDDDCHRSGAALLALHGDIEMLTAVAQGCRPIGEPMFASGCAGAKVSNLDGRPAIAVINDLFEQATADDRALMQQALFVGVAMRGGESDYRQGDFLVRNVAGADPDQHSIWIGAELHENQVVQFHIRDRETSARDLDLALARLNTTIGDAPVAGGLLFSCTGRGRGLYGQPDHDTRAFAAQLGAVPLGGFFCNGEIGPVGGQTFVHAYTSAFALFRPPAGRDATL